MILRITTWFFLFFLSLGLFLYRLLICFSFKPELCNGESNNIWKILSFSNGGLMYNNPEKLPFEIFQYTPLSQLPIVLSNFFISPNNINYLYYTTVFGRCYELVVNLLMFFLLYRMMTKIFKLSNKISLVVCLLIGMNFTQTIYTIRPDSTLLLLLVATVYYYITSYTQFKNRNLSVFFLSVLFSLCFITKQDGIIISIPIAIHLVLNKEYKVLVKIIFFSIITLLVILSALNLIFGDFFLFSILNGINNPSSLQQAFSVLFKSVEFYWHVFLVGIPFSIYSFFKRKNENVFFISILSLFYLLFGFVTTMKNGSWVNYYVPSILFFIVLIFISIRQSKLLLTTTISFLLVGSLFFMYQQFFNYTSLFLKDHDNKFSYYHSYNSMKKFKKHYQINKNDNVLVLGYLERNFLFQNSIMINTEYYCNSKFDYTEFISSKNQKVDFIIIKENEINSLIQLLNFFNINLDYYKCFKHNDYVILKRYTKKFHQRISLEKLILT